MIDGEEEIEGVVSEEPTVVEDKAVSEPVQEAASEDGIDIDRDDITPEELQALAKGEKKAVSGSKPQDTVEKKPERPSTGKLPPKTVPLTALHEERQKRQGLERRLAELDRELATYRGRMEALASLSEAKDGKSSQDPYLNMTPDQIRALAAQDPIAALEAMAAKLALYDRRFEEANTFQQETLQDKQAREAEVFFDTDAARFAQSEPNFQEATQWLIGNLANQLRYDGVPEEQIPVMIRQGLIERVLQCRQSGRSPAEYLFGLAKVRGWQGPAQIAPENQQNTPQQIFSSTSNVANKSQSSLNRIKDGISSAKSLSGSAGVATKPLSLEELASKSDEEFLEWARKLPKHKLKEILGG